MAQLDLIAVQKEQVAWSEKNFGKQPALNPLEGMIEELLEFTEAWDDKEDRAAELGAEARAKFEQAKEDARVNVTAEPNLEDFTAWKVEATYTEAIIDAIGDIAIYMLDYCGKKGWQFNDIWLGRSFLDEKGRKNWSYLVPHARRLAHHDLKGRQGIRGTPAEHETQIMRTCSAILAHLEFVCRYMEIDFLAILDKVWSKVKLRDWTKNKTNAHEIAEAQAASK